MDHGFWREFRTRMHKIKPDILIVGEILHDASFLRGDRGLGRTTHGELCPITAPENRDRRFCKRLTATAMRNRRQVQYAVEPSGIPTGSALRPARMQQG